RVRASNAAGSGEWSQAWQCTTAPAADALVAHWKTDEGTGTGLEAATGNRNHASTPRGPASVGRGHAAALGLNGNRQHASAPDSPSLNPGGAITLAAWVKPEKATGTQYVIKKMELTTVDGYELTLLDGGNAFFRFNRATSGTSYSLNSL